MIDPINITEYDASDDRLQEIAIFTVLVAGNNAITTAKGLEKFLDHLLEYAQRNFTIYRDRPSLSPTWPFSLIRWYCRRKNEEGFVLASDLLKRCGVGKFTRKGRAVVELAFSELDLRNCTVEDLDKIYGIGLKTANFFILHTRRDSEAVVPLDTHALHFLRDRGHNVPKSAPGNPKKYHEIARIYEEYVKGSGKTLAEFDLEIWNQYSKHKERRDESLQERKNISRREATSL